MPAASRPAELDLGSALLSALATSERINHYLLDALPDAAWRAETPGEGRSIAAVFSHLHNTRLMWLKAAAKGAKLPAQLDRLKVTRTQASKEGIRLASGRPAAPCSACSSSATFRLSRLFLTSRRFSFCFRSAFSRRSAS